MLLQRICQKKVVIKYFVCAPPPPPLLRNIKKQSMLTHLHAVDKLLRAEHALPPLPILQGQSAIEPPRDSPVGNAEEGVDEATVGGPEIGCQDTHTHRQTDSRRFCPKIP